jgi:TonB family protein
MLQSQPRRLRAVRGATLVSLSVMGASSAWAQAAAPAPQPPNTEAVEKAQRETDKVFKWILIQADKPKRPDAKPATAVTVAPAPAPKPVARAKGEGITERVTPSASQAEAAKGVAAAAPAAAPTPAAKTETASAAPLVPQTAEPAAPQADATLALAPSSTATKPPPAPEPEDDVPLVLQKQVDPEFPPSVMQRLQKGSVQVRFEVLPDGSVRQREVVKTSHPRLNAAALDAVAQWRFQPLKHSQFGVVELAFDLQ